MLKLTGISLTFLSIILLLQGCAAVVVGGAATTAVVAHDRRTAGTMVEDQAIELKFYDLLSQAPELRESRNIKATSYNKVVLLTGQAGTDVLRRQAE